MNIAGLGRVALQCHSTASFLRDSVFSYRSLLLLGGAAGTLVSAGATSAAEVGWINSDPLEMLWEDTANWSSGVAPASGDVVKIGTGNSGLYTDVTVGTVNVEGGLLWINRNGVLNAGTVNVTGGQLALSKGNLAAPTNPGPQGAANIATLLNITGGTVERYGLIELGDTGTVTQSGGSVLNPVQIHTPSYVQTGGSMVGQVTASTYDISGTLGDASPSLMAGTVTLDGQFTMGDGSLITGTVAGNSSAATVVQTGGFMDGSASGLASYSQTGGTVQGHIAYTETFELSGDGTILWGARLVGDDGAVFEQSGGTMGGTAEFEGGTGISKYIQTGGDMTGSVITDTYEASGGTIAVFSEISFAELFALSGDASLGDIYLNGDGDAAMTQTGGTMGAWVSGIETYTMSGGTILQATQVLTDAFVQSGGTINSPDEEDGWRAHIGFTTYELSGDGSIGLANVVGGADATMTQSGGTMGGHVYSETPAETIAKYTQTGGDLTGRVTTETYEASGGTISGRVNFSELFALSGDAMVSEGFYLNGDGDAVMMQSGGTLAGGVGGIAIYTMSGGTIAGTVDFADHFELSGGRIEYVDIVGDVDATMTQTGGSMGGKVSSRATDETIAKYTQTGGSMNAEVYARTYDVSGGSVDGMVVFSELFALSGDAIVGDHYIWGDGTAVATQSGGTMGGEVSDITSYDQSGGAMTGSVATVDYTLSGGAVSGPVHFGGTFALSATGEVVPSAVLYGDWSAIMTQSGGTMDGTVTGISSYSQSGGTMGGSATGVTTYTQSGGTLSGAAETQTYALSGGTLSGTVRFGTSAALSGDGSVTTDGKLIGDGSATMAQTGGAMDGMVSGIAGYAQSGGAMGGTVTTSAGYTQSGGATTGTVNAQTYALSGGTLSGQANFDTSAALSGTGSVTATGKLVGDGSATMAQTGGAMDGTVTGVSSYTQSDGTMGGNATGVTTYTQSGGTLSGAADTLTYALTGGTMSGQANFGDSAALSGAGSVTATGKLIGDGSATMAQTGGTMNGAVSGITGYTQSGGAMGGTVAATTYAISGGTLSGEVTGFSSFLLSGDPDDVIVSGKLVGAIGSTVTQTGGRMNGNVSGIANYVQHEKVGKSAVISFSEIYDLVDGQVEQGAQIIGGAGSAMTQAGPGKMGGTVTGIDTYTQTAGTMQGSVSTGSYALSAGTVSKIVNFSDAFVLGSVGARQSGQINGSAVLTGGLGSTMTQLGGSMKGTVSGVSSYTQTAGTMGGPQEGKPNVIVGRVSTGTYNLSGGTLGGQVDFSTLLALTGTGEVSSTATLIGSNGSTMTQTGGTMNGAVTGVGTYEQSASTMGGSVAALSYALSGGTVTGDVEFSTLFALSGTGEVTAAAGLVGSDTATMTQAGGAMNGTVTGIGSYAQSGGTMDGIVAAGRYDHAGGSASGTIDVATYTLSGETATSSGTIMATTAFNLAPDSGTVTVDAKLSGAGDIIKSGLSTVVLANDASDFTGSVAVNGGVLEVRNAALPGEASVTIADMATLRFNTAAGISTRFDGTMSGSAGVLEKTGLGTLTLGGDINLGALHVGAGVLKIGNGAPEEASFDSAYIGVGATLYVASGATLRIRIPKNIANFGILTNDGTVYDDLDNAGMFVNNADYFANVASNTRDIANNSPGKWTGDVLANNGWINNNDDATWTGNVVTNDARVANAGGTWRGNILSNSGHIINDNRADETDIGYWVGDVVSNANWVFNGGGGNWTGDVRSNAGLVMNDLLAIWNGNVLSNAREVWNGGGWNGSVLGNASTIHNAGGVWTGNVGANTGTILNTAGVRLGQATGWSTWNGDVISNGGTISNGAGSSWTGSVMSNAAAISNNGTWTGTVASNGVEGVDPGLNFGKLIYNSATGSWNGDIEKNYSWIFNEGGTWTGSILSNNAQIWNDNQYGEVGTGYWIGDVVGNAGTVFNGGGGNWAGDILGNSRSAHIKNDGAAVWTGNVLSNAGGLENYGTWTGDVSGNSGTIVTGGLWTGNFNNAGRVLAQNRIVGAFDNGGTLQLTGDLSGITTLFNGGVIDLKASGSQRLSVASASFASGSFLDVQIDPNGNSDQIVVAGQATLGGSVRISNGGARHTDGQFTIITAGSISGAFDAVTTDLAFLAPHLSYDPQAVAVVMQRNDLGFSETGATGNQMAVGAAVEALGAGNPLYDAALWLTQAEAQSALDQLSGEPHVSQAGGALETARVTGQIASNRVDQAFAVLAEGGAQVSSYAAVATGMPGGQSGSNAVWGQFYGAHGVVDAANGNAGVASSNGGVVIGLDGLVGDWRLGLLLQGGFSGTQVAALNASANSTDYGVGLYGGRQFGDTLLSFGATYTRHDNSTTRQVGFPGFTDMLSANYASGTSQVFGNVSHAFDFGAVSLKPYAGLAYVSNATDGFSETGGPAALSSTANVVNATFASLGLGVEQQFVVGGDMLLTASGSVGWRHAFAETPISMHRFGVGPAFSVTGKPAASDVLTLGAGLALDVDGGINLDLSYSGQIGNGTQNHALQGAWSKQF